jgi:hypothetical protein
MNISSFKKGQKKKKGSKGASAQVGAFFDLYINGGF